MSAAEDSVSTAGTEDVLLRSQNSSETISSAKCSPCADEKLKRRFCGVPWQLVFSIFFLVWGIATMVWPPYKLLMNERLRMKPGLPPFDWWKDPPDKVLFRVYLFNVTNSEEFLNNSNTKLNMLEVGPIIFKEKLIHTNVIFNDNGTMTYVATRKAIYLPEMNTIDLNATIIIPNWALLGIASHLAEHSFFVKLGFNLMMKTTKSKQFIKLSVNDFLWNFTDPLLHYANKVVPKQVPMDNLGVLSRIYTSFTDTVTVFIGTKHGNENFFSIDKYNGVTNLPNLENYCGGSVVNSTEGVAYPQEITKNTTLKYWRKTFTQVARLKYHSDAFKYGVHAYRFNLVNTTFDRTQPPDLDCFKGHPVLPNGVSDVSDCHFGFPLASSFPHFLHGDKMLRNHVTGLQPNISKHGSFVIVEPKTGVPLESKARSQSNLVVRNLKGFSGIASDFSNTVIPMFWIEYNQVGLPWYIIYLMYFQVNILPILQIVITIVLWMSSATLLYFYILNKKRQRLLQNKFLVFEQEPFVNKL